MAAKKKKNDTSTALETVEIPKTGTVHDGPPPPVPYSQREIRFNVDENQIATMREKVLPLKIDGVDDKKGYLAVRTARLELVALRAGVEKDRKEQKADAIEFGRKLDTRAKEITVLIEEIEKPLHDMEKAIDAEREAQAAARQKAKDDMVAAREQAFADVGVTLPFSERINLYSMTEEDFQAKLEDATLAYRLKVEREEEEAAELARLRAEEAERQRIKDEEERQAREAEAARVEEQRKKNEEEAAELARQRREFEERQAAARAEEERKEREAKAAKDLEEAQERARQEADRKAREAAEAAEHAAAVLPDKQKMLAYIEGLRSVKQPEMGTEEGKAILRTFNAAMRVAATTAAQATADA